MKRVLLLMGLSLMVLGCSRSTEPAGEANAAATGKPALEDTKGCIVAYLSQCGWKDVQLVKIDDRPEIPREAMIPSGEAWAFTFTASYTNIVGERQTSENWIAVLTRTDGKPGVQRCLDSTMRLVGGHSGAEGTDVAVLKPQQPAEEFPVILPPRE